MMCPEFRPSRRKYLVRLDRGALNLVVEWLRSRQECGDGNWVDGEEWALKRAIKAFRAARKRPLKEGPSLRARVQALEEALAAIRAKVAP